MGTKHILAATAGVILALASSNAFAIGPAGMALPSNMRPQNIAMQKPTLAPFAFVKFCVANAADCAETDSPDMVEVSPRELRELRRINFQVNRSIKPKYDAPGEDNWEVDVAEGDCEDYVLTKRRRLIELGWSPNALRVAIAYTPNDNGHAVLVVSTNKGDLVLDNRNNAVLNWRDTDLRWVMIQSPKNPLFWNEI
jgi:predicted transglutaminase-like cysteine proteinase